MTECSAGPVLRRVAAPAGSIFETHLRWRVPYILYAVHAVLVVEICINCAPPPSAYSFSDGQQHEPVRFPSSLRWQANSLPAYSRVAQDAT